MVSGGVRVGGRSGDGGVHTEIVKDTGLITRLSIVCNRLFFVCIRTFFFSYNIIIIMMMMMMMMVMIIQIYKAPFLTRTRSALQLCTKSTMHK